MAAKDNCLCSRPGQPVTCHLGGSSGEGSRERVDRGQSGMNHFQEQVDMKNGLEGPRHVTSASRPLNSCAREGDKKNIHEAAPQLSQD